MNKFKVMTVVGTRPELIKLARVIARLDATDSIEHTLVHTGQNFDYELNKIFFDELEIREPDHYLNAAAVDDDPSETIGKVLTNVHALLKETKPDAFLILGDTNSCMCAYAAKRLQIPVFHMEAGNRCFDFRVPEEVNRRLIDHISDINLCYTTISREHLINEGLPSDRVIKTGSPMKEVLQYYYPKIKESNAFEKLDLSPQSYFLVSSHREENVDYDYNFDKFIDILNHIAERFDKKVIVSTHPRTRARIDAKEAKVDERVKLLKPLGFIDYVFLQQNAVAVLSDSGTITEESSILNFPALNIRNAHERPEGMEEGAVMMTGLNQDRILQALTVLVDQKRGEQRDLDIVQDYDVHNVSEKILRIILSYTDYTNRHIWRKML